MSKSEEVAFVKLVELMQKSMNPTIDPGKDLIGFACGKFSEDNFDEKRGEYNLKYPKLDAYETYKKLLKTESLKYPSLVKARNFYKSCKSDIGTLLKDDRLRLFCGGFPALHENWSAENFDWIKTAAVLTVMRMDTIVKYKFGEVVADKYDIYIYTVEAIFANPKYNADKITEVLQNMGIAKDKIFEVIDAVNVIREKWDNYANSTLEESNNKGLREKFLNRFLEIAVGESNIKYNIKISSIKDIDRLLTTLSKIKQKDVANYLMCMAIFQYNNSPKDYVEYTLKYFTPALIAAAYSKYWNAGKELKLAEIWRRICETLEKKATEIIPSYNIKLQSLNDRGQCIAFDQIKIDNQYERLEITPDDFLKNILNIIFFNIISNESLCSMKKYDKKFHQILHFEERLLNGTNDSILLWFIDFCYYIYKTYGDWIKFENCEKLSFDYKIFEYAMTLKKEMFSLDDNIHHKMMIKHCFRVSKALQISFESYKTWLAENKDLADKQNIILKKLGLNNQQAFFVAYMQRFYGLNLHYGGPGNMLDNYFLKSAVLSLFISDALPFTKIF